MKSTLFLPILAFAGLIVVGQLYAQTHDHQGAPTSVSPMDATAMQKMMQDMMPAESDSAATKEFKQADMNMMKNMHAPFTGNADVDFRTHMIPHHQGAIDMAKVALKFASDDETRKIAQKIIDDQQTEITEMRDWLKKHGK